MKQFYVLILAVNIIGGCSDPPIIVPDERIEQPQASEKIKQCPEEMIVNKMPQIKDENQAEKNKQQVLQNRKNPSKYFLLDGKRYEIEDFDPEYLRINCNIPVTEVF